MNASCNYILQQCQHFYVFHGYQNQIVFLGLRGPQDPGIFRDGISLKFLSWDFTKKVWVLANLTNYMSPYGEFRCCHLVFGVFGPEIHVF